VLSNSINSLKSLLSRIRVHSLPEFEEDRDALLRSRAEVFLYLRRVGRFEAAENANNFLHTVKFTARDER